MSFLCYKGDVFNILCTVCVSASHFINSTDKSDQVRMFLNLHLQRWHACSAQLVSSGWLQETGSRLLASLPACHAECWGCPGRTGRGPGAQQSSGWESKRRKRMTVRRRGRCRLHLSEAAPGGWTAETERERERKKRRKGQGGHMIPTCAARGSWCDSSVTLWH